MSKASALNVTAVIHRNKLTVSGVLRNGNTHLLGISEKRSAVFCLRIIAAPAPDIFADKIVPVKICRTIFFESEEIENFFLRGIIFVQRLRMRHNQRLAVPHKPKVAVSAL